MRHIEAKTKAGRKAKLAQQAAAERAYAALLAEFAADREDEDALIDA